MCLEPSYRNDEGGTLKPSKKNEMKPYTWQFPSLNCWN